MDLCYDCHCFVIAISRGLDNWPRLKSFWNAARRRAGSQDCRLCKMMSDCIFEDPDVPMAIQPGNSGLRLLYGTTDGSRKWASDSPLSHVFVADEALEGKAEISVWSDLGSAAATSGNICTTPQLTSDNDPEAFALINFWIKSCFREHELCKRTMSGKLIDEVSGPQLPTRVLDVGVAGCEFVSLIESDGRHGNFCALSYCWGPRGTQSMVTTRDNIKDRRSGIYFGNLPKTFQDAILVTREIGIRYLWIDSLCIIQGDKTDWEKEAAKMAQVYQNAYLVIAASGAENPEQGCFSNKRRCPYAIKVPYYSSGGPMDGFMWLSVPVQGEFLPYQGPLRFRGWALQESCLARRLLRFTPAGITWKCSALTTGERYEFDLLHPEVWEEILEDFSDCELTYKEDRLAALEGLGRAIQEVTHDKYTLGIFESSISGQLFWMMNDGADESENLTAMPSWHWASRGGPKKFWCKEGQGLARLHHQIIIEPFGILKIRGFVAECEISSAKPGRVDVATNQACSDVQSTIYAYRNGVASPQWIHTLSGPAQLAGMAVFDGEDYERVHLLFLMQWEDFDNWIKTRSDPAFLGSKGTLKTLYLVLLLRPSSTSKGAFERVGMGFVILSPESDGVSATFENITLI